MNPIEWLLQDSDPSILFQVRRDLLKAPESVTRAEQDRISQTGWAKALLDNRKQNGQWGNGVYNPKWTCTHYALYELFQLGISERNAECRESAKLLLSNPIGLDGGINYAKTIDYSDVCINGMILTMASYFKITSPLIEELVDYLLKVQMLDGGWNCEYLHGANHSSLHTTISVLEGMEEYLANGNAFKKPGIGKAIAGGIEFILRHELYKSEKTGEKIRDDFCKFAFPVRWKYDILRCLDLFRKYHVEYDGRMHDALGIVEKAANKNGRWKAHSQAGKTYFMMEKNGEESKWNTLRAFRVLSYFKDRMTS